jgi:serine/threonine-protein kinase
VGGKYEIQSLIGVGCIGFVVAARRTDLGDEVALKFLRPEYSADRDLVQRFAREARFTARIKSEHVARVFDVGSLADGAPYIVMERLEGVDLRSHVIETGPLSTEVAVDFVLQACEALAGAHANSIIHRDIKPENLFLTRLVDGTSVVKVLDFGVSKLALTGIAHKTVPLVNTIAPVGSPLYMSPEQVRTSADVDARSDIWALGCVLYELLTATPAFDAPSLMQICAMILKESPPLRTVSPGVPDGSRRWCPGACTRTCRRVFRTRGELATALIALLPNTPVAWPSVVVIC